MYTIACFSSQNIRLADDGLITLLFGNIEVGYSVIQLQLS